ncbi:MAG: phage tail assembly chaperone [Novosphingobium meiothermophilum]
MGLAIVRLKWTPDEFWRATPHEFFAAIEFLEEQRKAMTRGR